MLLTLFGLLKFFVFHELELTSSATRRSLTGNAIHILLFPLCYILLYSDIRNRHQLLSLFLVLLIALGINFTGHRSGWIVFLFVLSCWYIYSPKKIELAWVPLWGVSIAAMLVMVIGSAPMNLRTGTFAGDFLTRINDTFRLHNATTQERLEKWKLSMSIIKQNPLLGLGRFPIYTSSAAPDNELLVKSFQTALNLPTHNLIATQAVHEGILGLSVLGIFFYVIFNQLQRIRIRSFEYHNFIKVYLLSFIVYSMFNTSFHNLSGKIFFFVVLGLLNAEILGSHEHSRPKEIWR